MHFNVQMLTTVNVVIQQGKVLYKIKEIQETKLKATYKLIKEEKKCRYGHILRKFTFIQ